MQRQTPLDTSLTGWVSGGARGCVHKADDKPLMQEITVNFSKGEWRDQVEHPQNYGFTSFVREAAYGQDQQIERCAEHFTEFMTGNRAFPVTGVLDDRRYRLRNFKEGESAIYDDQQQKIHVQRERIYTRSQYKVEMRVIADQEKMEGHGKHEEADRDQQLDKSRRWSTYVMDKEHILLERTSIDDANDKGKKQDEPGGEPPLDFKYDKHIKLLSRVHLDSMHIQVNTPTVSILWDEEKKFLKLNTGRNTITLEDQDEPTGGQRILITTPARKIIIDDKDQSITLLGTSTAVKVDDQIGKTRVGTTTASIPIAHLNSITANGDYIVANVAKKALVI